MKTRTAVSAGFERIGTMYDSFLSQRRITMKIKSGVRAGWKLTVDVNRIDMRAT